MLELGARVVRRALERGASAAECVLSRGRELSVAVRLGEPESIKQAEGKALGIRVFRGQRAATTHTSDFAWPAVNAMIEAALDIATHASEDPCAGLPSAAELGSAPGDFKLYSPAAAAFSPEQALDLALRAERATLACDPRLSNSDGASCDAGEATKVLVNSHGFSASLRRSSCSLSAVPIAIENGARQRDYWYSVARDPAGLEPPEDVGRTAAHRTLRRLGARKVSTAQVPVVFDPQAARSLLGHMLEAASGESVYRKASFWAGRLGEVVAAPCVHLTDDGSLPDRLGSSPFDAEGVPSRRTPILAAGRLEAYLLNCYTARQLGRATTGNAARALAGAPGVSCGNLTLEPGAATPDEIIGSVSNGLYVTEFLGFGVNTVTGDYSRGATGLWIENGRLAFPVEEITVAGNLNDMFRNITAIGSDLVLRGAVNTPTLRIEGMTVAGR